MSETEGSGTQLAYAECADAVRRTECDDIALTVAVWRSLNGSAIDGDVRKS